jgi:hypothetical protein
MTKMIQLDLSETEIVSLLPLHGMKALSKLYVVNAKIDNEQLIALKKALPHLEIHSEY